MSFVTLWDKFKELDISMDGVTPQSVNWMSGETSTKAFISWILENISADNVLNYGELEEYGKLCDAGKELHGEALDDALREAGFPVDDVPIDAFDLLEEKDEICFLKGQAEILSRVQEQLQSNLEKEKKEELVLQKKLQNEQRACFNDGQVLMKLGVHIKNNLSNFYQSLQQLTSTCVNYKDANTHHFLAKAPLQDFLDQCDTFEQNVKVFIKRQFEGKELAGKPHIELLSLMFSDDFDKKEDYNIFNNDTRPGEFKIHPKTLWEAEVRMVCAVAKLKSVQAALEHIETHKKTLNLSTLRLFCVRAGENCSVLEAEIALFRQHEVSTAAQNYVVAKIAAIAEDFARRRRERRRCRLKKLETLQENLTGHVLLTDVLWMLLRREKKLVKLAAEFIDESVTTLSKERAKHSAVMKLHQETQKKYSAFQKAAAGGQIVLVNSLCRMMGIEEMEDVTHLVNTITKLSKGVEEADRTRFRADSLDQNLVLEKSLQSLHVSLFAGPTRELLLIPADIVQKIGSVQKSMEELETEIRRLDRNFSSKQELYTKFPIQRDSRLLWAWFLVSPSQVAAALKRAEEAAEERKKS